MPKTIIIIIWYIYIYTVYIYIYIYIFFFFFYIYIYIDLMHWLDLCLKCSWEVCYRLVRWQAPLWQLTPKINNVTTFTTYNNCVLKDWFTSRMKISWSFTHPHVIKDVHVFLSSVENKWRFLRKTFQGLSSCNGLQWRPMGWRVEAVSMQLQRALHDLGPGTRV